MRELDALLRCLICKELLTRDTQQVDECHHRFHLHCFKEAIKRMRQDQGGSKCPQCMRPLDDRARGGGAAHDVTMDTVAALFAAARTPLLSLISRASSAASKTATLPDAAGDDDAEPRRKKQRAVQSGGGRECPVCLVEHFGTQEQFELHVDKCLNADVVEVVRAPVKQPMRLGMSLPQL